MHAIFWDTLSFFFYLIDRVVIVRVDCTQLNQWHAVKKKSIVKLTCSEIGVANKYHTVRLRKCTHCHCHSIVYGNNDDDIDNRGVQNLYNGGMVGNILK